MRSNKQCEELCSASSSLRNRRSERETSAEGKMALCERARGTYLRRVRIYYVAPPMYAT